MMQFAHYRGLRISAHRELPPARRLPRCDLLVDSRTAPAGAGL